MDAVFVLPLVDWVVGPLTVRMDLVDARHPSSFKRVIFTRVFLPTLPEKTAARLEFDFEFSRRSPRRLQ